MVVDGSLVRLIDQQICCLLVALVVSRSYERSWNSSLYIRRSFLNFLCWDVTICFLIVTTHSPTYSTTILTNAFGIWTDHYWFSTGSGYVRILIWIYLYNGRRISAANQCENRYFIYYGALRTEHSCWKHVLFSWTLLCRTFNRWNRRFSFWEYIANTERRYREPYSADSYFKQKIPQIHISKWNIRHKRRYRSHKNISSQI